MIKIFSGKWRGLGADDDEGLGMMLDFRFREVLSQFKGAKLAVFMAIALHSDENGLSWPSYGLLEKETGYGRDTIARALDDLCATEINGKRVLMRYRERDEKGQFTGSNRYLVFPTAAELTNESLPQLDFPTMENTNSGKSNLKINHSNKDNQSLSKERAAAKNAAASAPPISGNGNGHRTDAQKQGDLVDGAIAFSKKSQGRLDVSQYPEDVQAVIEKVCLLWDLRPPVRPKNGGGAYAEWIRDARYMLQAGGNLTLQALESLCQGPYEWMKTAMIARPGALIKAVNARAGQLRAEREVLGAWSPDDIERARQAGWSQDEIDRVQSSGWGFDDYVATQEKIRQWKAERNAQRAARAVGGATPA